MNDIEEKKLIEKIKSIGFPAYYQYRKSLEPKNEPVCGCCGLPPSVYNHEGHDPECIWFEEKLDE